MSTLAEQIADMEGRVLNAATVEAAARFHERLDVLRERQSPSTIPAPRNLPDDPQERAAYLRGYQAGYHALARLQSAASETP